MSSNQASAPPVRPYHLNRDNPISAEVNKAWGKWEKRGNQAILRPPQDIDTYIWFDEEGLKLTW